MATKRRPAPDRLVISSPRVDAAARLLCADVFLRLNSARLDHTRGDEIFALVMSTADDSLADVTEIAKVIRDLAAPPAAS